MDNHNEPFEITYLEKILKVTPIYIEKQLLYRIQFPDQTPPLFICSATNFDKEKFWTSIPEGRQELATETGLLIDDYFNTETKQVCATTTALK